MFPSCKRMRAESPVRRLVLIEEYRISSKTIALVFEGERYVAHTVPEGALVTAHRIETEKLVQVTWAGLTGVMLAKDLWANGERVSDLQHRGPTTL